MTSCGCWTQDEHPGVDFTSDKAGGPVAAMADGVVVKIETSEQARADLPVIGGCGRYVVLKHTYPNGGVIYTRYVQLGRIVGPKGEALAVGASVKAKDTIGEIDPNKVLSSRSAPSRPERRRRTRPRPSGMPMCPTWSGPATIPSIRRSSTRRRSADQEGDEVRRCVGWIKPKA